MEVEMLLYRNKFGGGAAGKGTMEMAGQALASD
jgi:hypothetical protein